MNPKLLKSLKILIVEDETKLSKLLRDAIKDCFHTVSVAKNGQEGLEKFKQYKPDIIITDIMMPVMDGLEMAIAIKQQNESIPIIVLSAFSDKEKLLKAIDIGITKYFIKPFDPEEVLDYITDLAQKIEKKKLIVINDTFSFDNNSLTLYENNKSINITKREREFIYMLVTHANEVLDKESIKNALWDDEVSDERLRTFIKRLRVKTNKTLIENASGQGYLISIHN